MISTLRSLWIWIAAITIIVLWLPFLGIIRLFDRTPARILTGRWFRRLGQALVLINPAWRVHVTGIMDFEPRHPYIVLSNHLSQADIPIISLLPWEMKWIAKVELFRVPFIGWMMSMAGDIPLDRRQRQGAHALLQARRYLQQKCSVMIFPEGTRSLDGRVHPFTDGAFRLAIKAGIPILPMAVDGSQACLPKGSWKFGKSQDVHLKVFPPIETIGMGAGDVAELRDRVRGMIIEQIAGWRGVAPEVVDAAV